MKRRRRRHSKRAKLRRLDRRMQATVPWRVPGRLAARDRPLPNSHQDAFPAGISIQRELALGICRRFHRKGVDGTLEFQLKGVEGVDDRSQVLPQRHRTAKQDEQIRVTLHFSRTPGLGTIENHPLQTTAEGLGQERADSCSRRAVYSPCSQWTTSYRNFQNYSSKAKKKAQLVEPRSALNLWKAQSVRHGFSGVCAFRRRDLVTLAQWEYEAAEPRSSARRR